MTKFVYGILKSEGSPKQNENPLFKAEIKIPSGTHPIFKLLGNGLATQVTFWGNNDKLRILVNIDDTGHKVINSIGCVARGMGLVGEKGLKSCIYCPIYIRSENWIVSCHIPFRFKQSFQFLIQNPVSKSFVIRDIHLYYLIPDVI